MPRHDRGTASDPAADAARVCGSSRRRSIAPLMKVMGVLRAAVTIRNPADRTRSWQGNFLVDTGAIDTFVPRPQLEAIGLAPCRQRTYETADGRQVTVDVTVGEIEILGELVGGTIIFGEAAAEPRIGVTALGSAGVEVDPLNQQLEKAPAAPLKELARRFPGRADPGPGGGDARDRMPAAPPGDPDLTGVEAALRRAAADARRQAAAAGGEVVVFRDGEIVREKPGREWISVPGRGLPEPGQR